jgi:D-3-phosphoglycerate dehydrogenase
MNKRERQMPKVLISDELSEAAVEIFRSRGLEVDFQPQLGPDAAKLKEIIGNYDGLAIRSATKVKPDIIAAAKNLKVIGRAGIGVDNVDIPAATAQGHRGDEHAVRQFDHDGRACDRADVRSGAPDLAAADARRRPASGRRTASWASSSTRRRWASSAAATSARIVADRALGPEDEGVAYDPFLSGRARGATGRREGRARGIAGAR